MRANASRRFRGSGLLSLFTFLAIGLATTSAAHAEVATGPHATDLSEKATEPAAAEDDHAEENTLGIDLPPAMMLGDNRPIAPTPAKPARASLEPPLPPAAPETSYSSSASDSPKGSYGNQILLVDALNLFVLRTNPLPIYLLGGAAIHVLNGNEGRALASAGLRFGAPIAGMYAGGAVADVDGAIFGLLGGFVGAMAVDAFVLGKDDGQSSASSSRSAVAPRVALRSSGLELGVGGRF